MEATQIAMKWLVIGANGQLGKSLCNELKVRGIEHFSWTRENADITNKSFVNSQITVLHPSVIINCAAWTDVDGAETDPIGAHAVNVLGPINLAVSARAVGSVFVHVSTDYVFSGVSKSPWEVDDYRAPVSVYGNTKAKGEDGVLSEYSEHSYIFRTAWLYSPYGKNFVRTMVRMAITNENPVRVVNDQLGQPTFASDLARQIVDCVSTQLPFGIYHGTNSGQGTWFDLALEVFSLCGADTSRVIPVSSNEFVRPARRPAYSVLSHTKWSNSEVAAMRDWKIALKASIPAIISAERSES